LRCDTAGLGATVAAVAGDLVARHHSVAVIAAAAIHDDITSALGASGLPLVPYGHASLPGHVALVRPELAKGLEFDAVVVAEPALILDGPGGAGLTYIALTRAVQSLVVVHTGDLPPLLARAAA